MLASLAVIIGVGMLLGAVARRLNLPALIGYLLAGIFLGPFVLAWVHPIILELGSDIRRVALIIILTRAGLNLNIQELRAAGRIPILMCFVPATVEIMAAVLFGPVILGFNLEQSLLVGSILAAVSPAVVVPRMLQLIHDRRGVVKRIPQMVLAGSSADDVYVLVLFGAFLAMGQGQGFQLASLLQIPAALLSGILMGGLVGRLLVVLFDKTDLGVVYQSLLILAVSFALMTLEDLSGGYYSGMIAIITYNVVLHQQLLELSQALSHQYNQLWSVAELFLFFLVGVLVEPAYVVQAGWLPVVFVLVLSLCRMVGVAGILVGSDLTVKERLFTMISYLPKATVQAGIGGVPLALGIAGGEMMLTVAALSILITAPVGAVLIDYLSPRWLSQDHSRPEE